MTIFDLLFLLAVLVSLVTLAAVLVLLLRGRWARALSVFKIYAVCAAAYLLAGLAVSFFRPQRVMQPGDPWCFDDWCLTVESVNSTPGPADDSYQLGLRLFSRARGVSRRASGAWIYLIDEQAACTTAPPRRGKSPCYRNPHLILIVVGFLNKHPLSPIIRNDITPQ